MLNPREFLPYQSQFVVPCPGTLVTFFNFIKTAPDLFKVAIHVVLYD